MIAWLVAFFLSLFGSPQEAKAQTATTASIIATCGSPTQTYTPGALGILTLGTDGKLCVNAAVSVTFPPALAVNTVQWATTTLGAPSNYGTSPGAVSVIGVNAFVTNTASVNVGNNVSVTCTSGCSGSTSFITNTNTASVAGTSLGAPSNYGTSPGAVVVQGVNAFVTNAPTVNQGTNPWVTYTATQNITQWASSNLGAPSNYGTSPGAVTVPGVNAFVTNAVAVTAPTVPWPVNVTQWATTALGAPSNYGTSPGAVLVPGHNAFVTNAPTVTAPTTPWPTNVTQWATNALGAPSNYGTSPGAVTVPGVNAFVTNAPTVTAPTTPWPVNLTQVGTNNVASTGVNGSLAVGGPTASGSSVAANPLTTGGRGQNAEATAVANAQVVNLALDLYGKLINSPYANRENYVRGAASTTGTSAVLLIAPGGANVKTYVTGIECYRNDAGTTAATVAFTDTVTTTIVLPNSGGGGGSNLTLNVPLVTASNATFSFTSGTALTSVFCNAQGYAGG